jgi:PilZ domain
MSLSTQPLLQPIRMPATVSAPIVLDRRVESLVARVAEDRRRHVRVEVTLLGRFMRANRQEYPCKLRDISVGGAGLMSPVDVEMDERVVVYLDQVGGVEGSVVRMMHGGFCMKFSATQHKREKLAAQLTFLINRPFLGDMAERKHERLTPQNSNQSLTLGEGLVMSCHVIDFSLSGASIATPARPVIGSEVQLGNLRCRVVRHHGEGIGVQFLDVQNPNALRKYFG